MGRNRACNAPGMKQTLVRSAFLSALVVILPGCVLINTALGVVGLLSSGPAQYAGAVYSVGEYTYEYAVNDKTPDEVVVEKVAWLFQTDEEPDAVHYADSTTIPSPRAEKSVEDRLQLAAGKASLQPHTSLTRVKLEPAQPQASTQVASNRQRPTPISSRAATMKKPASRTPIKQPVVATAKPVEKTHSAIQHTYIEHSPDPLLERITRMEQAFATAERMADHKPVQGIRYSVRTNEAGQTLTINGAWSIRHDVMQPPPSSSGDSVVQTTPQEGLEIIS